MDEGSSVEQRLLFLYQDFAKYNKQSPRDCLDVFFVFDMLSIGMND